MSLLGVDKGATRHISVRGETGLKRLTSEDSETWLLSQVLLFKQKCQKVNFQNVNICFFSSMVVIMNILGISQFE